jgi:hypothetical protein
VPVPAYTTAVFWKEFCERQWFYLRSLLGEPLTLGLGLAKNSRAETIVTWAVLSLLVLLPLVFRRRLGAICWALWAWYAVATIPLVVTYVSGRHLYYASVGLCVVLGSLLVKAPRLPRWLGASVLAVLFFLSAQKTQSSWNDSGRLSGETMAAVKSALSATKPGTPIFYDVSTTWEGAWNWAWASPFVVQDFFIKRELTQDRIFIETPGAYYNADYWWDRKDIKGLPAKAHLGVAFVFASAPGQVKVHFVGEKAFRPVAERLAAGNLNPDLWQWTVTTLRDAAAK